MSHRDVNMCRSESRSARVRCSPEPQRLPAAPRFRLVRLSLPWKTDRKRPFLVGCLNPLSAQHTATGWKMSRLGVSDGVVQLQDEWRRRRRRRRSDGGGGGVRGGFRGSEHDGVSWPPSLLLLFLPLLLLLLITHTNAGEEDPPRMQNLCADIALPSSVHPPLLSLHPRCSCAIIMSGKLGGESR